MKNKSILLPLLILLFCALNAVPLYDAWLNSPPEKLTWLAFLIWLSPLLADWRGLKNSSSLLLGLALIFSILGIVGSLNTLKYFALACAIAAFVPLSLPSTLWLLGAVAWMPLFGWVGARYFPEYIIPLKLGVAAGAAAILLTSKKGGLFS